MNIATSKQCVIPENLHTLPMEGIFPKTPHPPSYISLNFLALKNPPPLTLSKFQSLLWEEYGYFLELHNRENLNKIFREKVGEGVTKHPRKCFQNFRQS